MSLQPSLRDDDGIEGHARAFVACTLPKAEWTHAGHWAAALWLLRHDGDELDTRMPGLIRRYNESVGGVNSDSAGYHHTITIASLRAARAELGRHDAGAPPRRCSRSSSRGRSVSRTGSSATGRASVSSPSRRGASGSRPISRRCRSERSVAGLHGDHAGHHRGPAVARTVSLKWRRLAASRLATAREKRGRANTAPGCLGGDRGAREDGAHLSLAHLHLQCAGDRARDDEFDADRRGLGRGDRHVEAA